jgi:Sulfotransferase family
MHTVNKPNFLIVGAPKSGTTALYSYLSGHPDVGMSKDKEPHFLPPILRATRDVQQRWSSI